MLDNETQPDEQKRNEDHGLVASEVLDKVRRAQVFHKPDFDRMRKDAAYHKYGANDVSVGGDWNIEEHYTANLISPSTSRFASQVYAKNPKPAPRIEDRMDWEVWNGDIRDAQYAASQIQAYEEAVAASQQGPQPAMGPDGMPILDATGAPLLAPPVAPPAPLPDIYYDVVEEYNNWQERRQQARQIGNACAKMLDKFWERAAFKGLARQGVAQAYVVGVAWMKVGFQRKMDLSAEQASTVRDSKDKIATLERLIFDKRQGDASLAEIAELELLIEHMYANPETILSEGLTYELVPYNRIIVDPQTRSLESLHGCGWIAQILPMTRNRILEVFKVDVMASEGGLSSYGDMTGGDHDRRTEDFPSDQARGNRSLYDVIEFYDLKTRMTYVVCEGHNGFLRPPAAPSVYYDQGHPFFPLVFDHLIFDEKGLYPFSNVYHMRWPQVQYNRSRQDLATNRRHARPLYAVAEGMLPDTDKVKLATGEGFDMVELAGLSEGQKIADVIQRVPTAGVDMNLYGPEPWLDDMTRSGGTSEAGMGVQRSGTATSASIGAQMEASENGMAAQRVDEWIGAIAKASGKIMLAEMSRESVAKMVGRWALRHWPEGEVSDEDVRNDVHLSIVAGSSGSPNAAAWSAMMQQMGPAIMSVPGIRPEWLAKKHLEALDPSVDFQEAFDPALPSLQALGQGPGLFDKASGFDQSRAGMAGQNNTPTVKRAPGGQTFPMGAQPGQIPG